MSPLDYPDPAERLAAAEADRALAQLLGDYVTRRENCTTPEVLDLLTAAGDHGHQAITQMRDLIAFYEALNPNQTGGPS